MKKEVIQKGGIMRTYHAFIVLGVILLCLGMAGCSLDGAKPGVNGGEIATTTTTLKREYQVVSDKLMNLVNEHGGHDIALDLANDDEYNYLLERVTWGNKSRSNSSQLYASIEKLRQEHLRKRSNGTRADGDDRTVPEGNGHLITRMNIGENLEISSEAHGSVFGGFAYLYMDLIVWDDVWNVIAPYKKVECAAGNCLNEAYENNGASPTLETVGNYISQNRSPWDPVAGVYSRADTMFMYEDANGNFHVEYAIKELNRKKELFFIPLETVIEAPAHKALQPVAGVVTVCLGRRQPADCDHPLWSQDYDGGTPGKVLLPFKGRITFAFPIRVGQSVNGVFKPASDANFQPKFNTALSLGQGGGIQIFTSNDDINNFFWNHPGTKVLPEDGYKTLVWDITGLYGPWDFLNYGPKLWTNSNRVNLFVELEVQLTEQVNKFVETKAFIVPADYTKEKYEPLLQQHFGPGYEAGDYGYFEGYIQEVNLAIDPGEVRNVEVQVVGKGNSKITNEGWHSTAPIKYKWTVDRQPPYAVIYNAPPVKTMASVPGIRIGGQGVVAYKYKKDVEVLDPLNMGPDPVILPGDWSGQKDLYTEDWVNLNADLTPDNLDFTWAKYTLSVVGIDRAGNEQVTPTQVSWTIYPSGDSDNDTKADLVELSLDNLPSFYTADTFALINVLRPADHANICQYRLDNGSLEINDDPDTTPIILAGLPAGEHTLRVWGKRKATDDFLFDLNPTQYTWIIDTTAPDITRDDLHIAMATDNKTRDKTLTVEVAGNDELWTYDYSIDSNLEGNFIKGKRVNPLPNTAAYINHLIMENMQTRNPATLYGNHVLYIRAKNRAQQTGNTFAFAWTIEAANEYAIVRALPPAVTSSTDIDADVGGFITHYSYRYEITTTSGGLTDSIDWTIAIPISPPMKMLPLQFIWSCLADDSLIAMADGSYKEIQKVGKGEMVIGRSLEEGKLVERVLPVMEVTIGSENIPMYRINDTAGHNLLLTQGHPVVMANNTLKLARNLKAGDKVMTESGAAKLTAVSTEMYDRYIYNLILGTTEEYLAKRDKSGNLMFANGFLVGDNTLQTTEMSKAAQPPKDIFKALPKKWHKDYRNYLASFKK